MRIKRPELCGFILLFLLCIGHSRPLRAEAVELHVSPGGDDRWTGQSPDVNDQAGPFKTLTRARDAIRELKQRNGGKLPGPVTVYLRGGTYFLPEPFVLTEADSGTPDAPITYAAFEEERPILSGGQPVENWEVTQVNGRTCWVAKLQRDPAAPGTIRELWVDGKPRRRARHPNEGYLRIAEVPDNPPGTDWTQGQTNFRFAEGDLKDWTSLADAEAVVFTRWIESRLPIEAIDQSDRRIRFTKKSVFAMSPGDAYFLEGAIDFLDEPGEWSFNKATSALTYLPMPDEDPGSVQAVVPALTQVLRIEEKPEAGQYVEHLTFRGLTFSHSEWGHDSPGADDTRSGFSQAAVGVPGMVAADGLRHSTFDNCAFTNAGNYGLVLGRGAQHNRISRCTFTDLGAGGVRIGETAARENKAEQSFVNELSDSRIFECGGLFPSSVGLWIGQSYDNRISHNEIHDLYYTGISVGWSWGYAPALCRGNIIEHNHVHHCGVRSGGREEVLSDMGGIYTLGPQPGTIIRFNRFHHIFGAKYGGWGIYFDEGSTGIVAEKNLVYRTTHGGFHQHYGRDNIFRNNIIAFARTRQVERTRAEEHTSFTFERNIVYWSEGELLTGNWDNYNVVFDHNVYWRTTPGDYAIANLTVEQWRERGMDQNSLFQDPQFVDPENDNFTLSSDSPAFKVGFEAWDQSDVGPRPAPAPDHGD